MILNLSIGEEVERDAQQLEGKLVQQDDEISPVPLPSDELENEKMKNSSKATDVPV
jgi:hypothetical protein